MISIANSDQFGSNVRIAPGALIDDGYLDLCIVRKPRIYYAVLVLPFLFSGSIHITPFVKIIRTKEITIIQQKNTVAHIDGDAIDLGKRISIQILPASLKVITV